MYNPKSLKAEEFISDEEIRETLAYADANKENVALIDQILAKAKECKGLTHREASVLLACPIPEKIQDMYDLAAEIKKEFYGNRIVLFAPLYLSNYCVNGCVYCPYHKKNQHIARKKLTQEEIVKEVTALQDMGHKRLAIEAGEDPINNPIEYILECIQTIYSIKHKNGAIRRVNVNIAATTVENYRKLKDAGITPMTMDDAYATCVIGYHLARLVGEDKVKEIVTEGEWDDPAVLQMAQDIEELASNGYYSEMVGSNVWPAGQNTELALGTAAMYLNGSWLPNEVKEMAGPDFHWGCFAYPALTDGANGIETNNFGAQVFGINKDTKLAKEAFDLITFLTKGEYDQKLADETVGIPADTTNTEWPAMVECAKPVIEQSTNRFTWACGVESNVDMTPVIKENFIKLMAGSITADEFVSTMQDAAK